MSKLTEKVAARVVASAALKRRIPPARPMPVIRARTPGWISAKAVGSYVPGLTKKAFERFGFCAAALITDWEKIAGSRIAAYTEPQRLKWPRLQGGSDAAAMEGRPGATLVIKVDPARALDAEYAAAQIIDRINAYFGYRAVAELRLVQAPVSATGNRQPAAGVSATGIRHPASGTTPTSTVPAAGCRLPVAGTDPLAAALARLAAGVAARHGR